MTGNTTESLDRLLTEAEAANVLGFSKNTLRAWRVTGRPKGCSPPAFIKCGRSVRYRLSELVDWMNAQPSRISTSDAGFTA